MKIPQNRGEIFIQATTNPAAGVELSITVPVGEIWRFISASATLVTDATVINRTARLTFDDGTSIFAFGGPNFNQAASLTFIYCFAPDISAGAQTSLQAQVPVPRNIYLQAGFRISTLTGSFQAGDNWGVCTMLIERWRISG